MKQLRDKFRGALLGAAVGDALGAPFEGAHLISPAELTRLREEPGQLKYTDDTHMTLGLAQSLVACRGFDGDHMASLFSSNYSAEPWRGYGAGPPRVFRLIDQGVPWYKASSILFNGSGSYGNGAAMRVAPAGLMAYRDLERVARLARQTGLITHSHELGLEGAVLQACAIAILIRHSPVSNPEPSSFLALLKSYLNETVYLQKLEQVELLLPAAAREEVITNLGNGIEAFKSVPTAVYAYLRHAGSFPDAVLYAISLGGDADTIASMTGALAGAHLGEESIPAVWRDGVEGAEQLCELADALLELVHA